MKLYYSPGACSMAPHIVLREAGFKFDLEKVDIPNKKTESGGDFWSINPKGYVPALRLDDGQVLTEVGVICQYLADQKPESALAPKGSVTAGNSSQTSDGAGALVLVSERILKQLNLTPLARFVSFAVRGVPPEIMGIGPKEAIPAACRAAGITQDQIDWFELNEAFAAQSLAVIQDLGLDPAKVNPMGGAIALGHPLGATGAIRSATVIHALRRKHLKYGMVTMCVGTGMGAAGIFERV